MLGGDWSWSGYPSLTCQQWRKFWHEVLRWHLVRGIALALAWLFRVPVYINIDPSQVRLSEWAHFDKIDPEPVLSGFEVHRRAQAAKKRLHGCG